MQQTVINPKNKKQGGYTLVELAIAVAILAVLIVAGLSGVQGILTSGKVNDQIKVAAKLGAKLSSNFSSSSTSNISLATVANLGGWETSKITGTGDKMTIKSSFNSGEFITPNTAAIGSMPANSGFIYTISGVPSAACPDLANGLSALVFAISIQAPAATPAAVIDWPTTNLVKLPDTNTVIPGTLATACTANTSSDFVIALKP